MTTERIYLEFSPALRDSIQEALEDAGFERQTDPGEGERRFRHPGGSTARLFDTAAAVYPPGGTRNPTGRIPAIDWPSGQRGGDSGPDVSGAEPSSSSESVPAGAGTRGDSGGPDSDEAADSAAASDSDPDRDGEKNGDDE